MERQTLTVRPTHTLQFLVCLTRTCLHCGQQTSWPTAGVTFPFFMEFFHSDTREPLRLWGVSASAAAACTVCPAICGGIQPLLLAHPSVCIGKDKDIQYIPENLNVWVAVRARHRGKERTTGDMSKKRLGGGRGGGSMNP